MSRRLAALAAALALAASCRPSPTPEQVAAPEDLAFARQYLALFPARSFAAIEAATDVAKGEQFTTRMTQIADAFPQQPPHSVRLVDARRSQNGNRVDSELSFEYEYPDRVLLAQVAISRAGQTTVVKRVQVQGLKATLEQMNRFTLRGKTALHYGMLAVAVFVFLFVLYAAATAVRTPIPGGKWLWIAFILVGLIPFGFNWTTGTLVVKPMGVQVLGSWFSRQSAYSPLILWTSIPAGAIAFFIQRREWRERTAAGDEETAPEPDRDEPGT